LQALSEINIKKIKFLVMGEGPEKEFLENLTNELGLNDRVKFLGYVANEEKYVYLKNSNSFILVSMHEGFGIVFMESMFIGLPIISSNHGGQVDFLKDEENAILIDVGDVEACKKSMLRVYKDKALRSKMYTKNKKKVKDFYGEGVAYEYIKIFRELKR